MQILCILSWLTKYITWQTLYLHTIWGHPPNRLKLLALDYNTPYSWRSSFCFLSDCTFKILLNKLTGTEQSDKSSGYMIQECNAWGPLLLLEVLLEQCPTTKLVPAVFLFHEQSLKHSFTTKKLFSQPYNKSMNICQY